MNALTWIKGNCAISANPRSANVRDCKRGRCPPSPLLPNSRTGAGLRGAYSPSTRRERSSRISSAMLVGDNRTPVRRSAPERSATRGARSHYRAFEAACSARPNPLAAGILAPRAYAQAMSAEPARASPVSRRTFDRRRALAHLIHINSIYAGVNTLYMLLRNRSWDAGASLLGVGAHRATRAVAAACCQPSNGRGSGVFAAICVRRFFARRTVDRTPLNQTVSPARRNYDAPVVFCVPAIQA